MHDEAWGECEHLDAQPEPAELPVDALPAVLAAHVRSVAAATQTPQDLAALLSLTAVSVSIHGRARVRVRAGWHEPLGIYGAAIMAPGARKSPVYAHMFAPLYTWEAEQTRQYASATARGLTERTVLERQLERAQADAAKGNATLDDVEAARVRLADHRVPRARQLIASDATPEALPGLMIENGGAIAVCAPEGDFLRVAAGRYSRDGAANLGVLKSAWSCEPLRISRVGRAHEYVARPSLVLALAMQPIVLETIGNADTLRGEGVYGRILWCVPPDTVGRRLTGSDVPPFDRDAADAYARALRDVLAIDAAASDEAGPLPHDLRLSTGATRELDRLEASVEQRMRDDGDLYLIRDWAAKLCGQCVRIAALLHVLERDVGQPIVQDAMAAAAAIGDALATHALVVLGRRADPRTMLLRDVLARAAELPADARTVRDLYQRMKGRSAIACVADLDDLIEELRERGLLRTIAMPRLGRGRPGSPRIELHPDLESGAPTPRPARTPASADGDDPLAILQGSYDHGVT